MRGQRVGSLLGIIRQIVPRNSPDAPVSGLIMVRLRSRNRIVTNPPLSSTSELYPGPWTSLAPQPVLGEDCLSGVSLSIYLSWDGALAMRKSPLGDRGKDFYPILLFAAW